MVCSPSWRVETVLTFEIVTLEGEHVADPRAEANEDGNDEDDTLLNR